jgi:hypothetical protein
MKVSLSDLRKLIREAVEEVMATEGVEEQDGGGVDEFLLPFMRSARRGGTGAARELSREMPKFDLSTKKGPDLRIALQALLDEYALTSDESGKKQIVDQIIKFTEMHQMKVESLRRQLKLLKNR